MKNKLTILPDVPSWHEKEQQWDVKAKNFQQKSPIKSLNYLPQITGITRDTARFLRLKSIWYLIRNDKNKIFAKYFFKKPISYSWRLLKSYYKKKSYKRDEDFFFYGLSNELEFEKIIATQDPIILVGFSYCQKPFECPSGRFSSACIHDPEHPTCGQCFIGKCMHMLPENSCIPLWIPTIHYIGEKVFEATFQYPGRQVLFLITACEMTLKMFGDWGNMVGAKGIGVRLDGRICNTMKAFVLSEEGIKPGLTIVLDATQKRMLELLSHFRNDTTCEKA